MAKPKTIHTITSLLERTIDYGQCKEWKGYFSNKNPLIYHEGRLQSVRKIICILQSREVPPGSFVSASCGNHNCVSPHHIVIRSKAEHVALMASKVRHLHPTRLLKLTEKAQVRRKLTDEQIDQILGGEHSCRHYAQLFSVNKSVVSRIRRGQAHRMHSARNNPFFRLLG